MGFPGHSMTFSSQLPPEADVVIIGGGIVGASTAYYLAGRNAVVALLEKGEVADEQSGRNWGWTRQQGRNPREIPLAMLARAKWNELAEEVGADMERIQEGSLRLAYDDAEMARQQAWVNTTRALGLESSLLERAEVEDLIPQLEGPYLGGAYTPSDGQAEPRKATRAVAGAAAESGASVVENCAVEGIETRGGAVKEVVTEKGRVKAPVVVCAAGAWSSRVARMVGLRLPQRAVRATVACTTPAPVFTHTVVWGDGVAFRQKRDGTLYVAGGGRGDYDVDLETFRHVRWFLPNFMRARRNMRVRVGSALVGDVLRAMPWSGASRRPFAHTVGVEPEPNRGTVDATMRNLKRLVPSLEGVGVLRTWAGRIDATPDAVPVLGEAPGVRGFYVGTGFSGHGFALGPGAGFALSELILDGEASVDLHPLRYSRFEEGDMADYSLTI